MIANLIGSLATAITITSFVFKNIRTIRILNLIGCFIWLIYGWLRQDMQIIAINMIIAFIHIITLIKEALKLK